MATYYVDPKDPSKASHLMLQITKALADHVQAILPRPPGPAHDLPAQRCHGRGDDNVANTEINS